MSIQIALTILGAVFILWAVLEYASWYCKREADKAEKFWRDARNADRKQWIESIEKGYEKIKKEVKQ